MSKGFVTLPAEAGQDETVIEFCKKWGADAIRDSDGTELSPGLLGLGYDVYSTICLVRADQAWARSHCEHLPRKFLMSEPVTARSGPVEIDPMAGYFDQKYQLDAAGQAMEHWEVIDRTTGQAVARADWEFDAKTARVVVRSAAEYHQYTVNFLVSQIWDSTSMYNHITNNWTSEHVASVDPYYPETYRHLMKYFDQWLQSHADTDVVRLTTLAYHFTNDSGPGGSSKYRDWQGYTDTISLPAMEDFARRHGCRPRSEDIVDAGYYNATDRVPSDRYLDWMEFVQDFVLRFGKDLVDRVHRAGKKAGIFWGDHWIGVEPYSPKYRQMGIDIDIGAVGDGVSLRRLADAPGGQVREARFYPYFFPDVFRPGGDPLGESIGRWVRIRRAMLRNSVDRIGYGGYLSLAAKFPEFVEHVADLCREFRQIKAAAAKGPSWRAPVRVAVLTAWGALRSWINDKGAGYKFHDPRQSNLLECLAGLPVEVRFLSFRDIERDGLPGDMDVLVNNGEAETAWSGGRHWASATVQAAIRRFVDRGGGFLGAGGPSACQHQGRYFQLSDVMGVQKEVGQSMGSPALAFQPVARHFILDDQLDGITFGPARSNVFLCQDRTDVLRADGKMVLLAARGYGKGRSVYLAGLPYSLANARLLLRCLFWAAGKNAQLHQWFSTHPDTDCAAYLDAGALAVVNNVGEDRHTVVHTDAGKTIELCLKPYECRWLEIPARQ